MAFFRICLALGATAMVCCANAYAKDVTVSTSKGLYSQNSSRFWLQNRLESNAVVSAFKTIHLDGSRILVAWGVGRHTLKSKTKKPSSEYRKQYASVEIVNRSDVNDRTVLFTTSGTRIRDMQFHKRTVIAVGHDRADIHVYGLDNKRHKVAHLSRYDNAIAHAIELGDLDSDGIQEAYVTVTTPNVMGGLGQEGQIIRVDIDWRTLEIKQSTVLDVYAKYASHAKTLKVVDLNDDNKHELVLEIAPQIEVYSEKEYEYVEPMRFITLEKHGVRYETKLLAEANLRLGRILSYADIDRDGTNELFFVDFNNTGIYVLENSKDRKKAKGENVNIADTGWQLSRIEAKDNTGRDLLSKTKLRSNQVIYLNSSQQLLTSNSTNYSISASASEVTLNDMTINYFNVVSQGDLYYLRPGAVNNLRSTGDIWYFEVY
jgi:hypothetical protein